MVFGQGSTFPLVSVIILVDCRYCSPLVIQIQIQAQKEILHNNTLCTLTAYGYAPAPYVAPVAHAGPLKIFTMMKFSSLRIQEKLTITMQYWWGCWSNSVLIISGWKWSVKFASHYSSSLLPFAHNQTCPQSCVTHKTDFNPNAKVSSSSSYPTTLAAYAPAAAYAGSALAHHGPLTVRQPITDFISFAKF